MLDLLAHGSYLGIVLILALTGLGLPIPEEVPVVAAGVLSANGTLRPGWAFAACLVGGLLGDSVMYAIGRHFGRGILDEHPRFTGFLTPERESRIELMIQRHALWAMFVARFVVGLRSPMYLTAGILRMPFRRFLLIDVFSATIVIGLFFGLSYRFGEQIGAWIRNSQLGLTLILLIVVAMVIAVVVSRRRRKAELEVSHLSEDAEVAKAESAREPSESVSV